MIVRSSLVRHFIIFLIILLALGLYVAVYVRSSALGRYEPACYGLNGVKWYDWAPRGFYNNGKWNHSAAWAFLPLYWVDVNYWHTYNAQDSGRYPVDVPMRPSKVTSTAK